jgi:hypothetical protein
MDPNGVKAPQGSRDVESMMKEMMDQCCSGKISPADMCRRMMRSMGRASDAEASSAPGSGTTPDERGSSSQDDAHRASCGPRSCCAPERL